MHASNAATGAVYALPIFFAFVAALASIVELKALNDKRMSPGDLGISRPMNENTLYIMKSGEIWNSRLAMIGLLGCVISEAATKTPVIDMIRP